MVCVLCTVQILVALSKEMAEGFVDNSACFVAWASCFLISKGSCICCNRITNSIFNESYIMAKLKIQEFGRNWWTRHTRRDIYINGKHSGTMVGEELEIDVDSGHCKVVVRNVFPYFSSTAYINIEEEAENYVTFRDTKWFLNFLMALNVGLIFLRGLIPITGVIRQVSNIYAYIWLLFSLFNRDGYFKTFAYSKVAIDAPTYS